MYEIRINKNLKIKKKMQCETTLQADLHWGLRRDRRLWNNCGGWPVYMRIPGYVYAVTFC